MNKKWADSLTGEEKIIVDGDPVRCFSVLRQRPDFPDYFYLDFDDGSYLMLNDNDFIARATEAK